MSLKQLKAARKAHDIQDKVSLRDTAIEEIVARCRALTCPCHGYRFPDPGALRVHMEHGTSPPYHGVLLNPVMQRPVTQHPVTQHPTKPPSTEASP